VRVAELATLGGLEVLRLDELAPLDVDAFVTTRSGGVSKPPYDTLNLGLHVGDDPLRVQENRARLAAAARCHLDDLVFLDQVHGGRVAVVGEAERGRGARMADHALSATDAAVTTTAHLPLVVLIADCAPIVLVDPAARVLGVAHAGWRGVAVGVIGATVEAMARLGASPQATVAVVGPRISSARYEVGDEVVDAVLGRGVALEPAIDRSGERPHLDVGEACRRSLMIAGISAESISITEETSDQDAFFSDRAARPCGRFALLARLAP
jgi:YfiH family protein